MLRVHTREGVKRSLGIMSSDHRNPHSVLTRLLNYLPPSTPALGVDDPVRSLQRQVAQMLGKEAAILLPTGKMAQQIALRLHAESTGRRIFAAHPSCHLANWEYDGFAEVHGLKFRALGDRNRLMCEGDIRSVWEPLAAVLWELPQRDIGGLSPDWETLCQQIAAARQLGAHTHMDGARLWEAQTFYNREYGEICGLFDTVYVSLYKTIGAARGALLVGSTGFIEQAARWAVRLGGESAGNWHLGAAGLLALHETIPRMQAFRDHALRIAAAINSTGVAKTVPLVPQTPMFRVRLPIAPEAAVKAHVTLCRETGLEVFGVVLTSDDPDACIFEISVAEGALVIDPAEVAEFLSRLVDRARPAFAATAAG
jgi:threonine aldolase